MKLYFVKLLILGNLMLGLYACNGSSDSTPINPAQIATKVQAVIYFDSFAKIPVSNTDASYSIRLHNIDTKKYLISSISIIDDLNKTKTKELGITTNCHLLESSQECPFKLHYTANSHGAYRLIAKLQDMDGKSHTISQMIITGGEVSNSEPINLDAEPVVEPQNDLNYSIAIPIYLNSNFNDIKVSNGQIYCSEGSDAGHGCTYYIDGKLDNNDFLLTSEIEGLDENGKLLAKNNPSMLIKKQAAHLLISNPGHQTLSLTNLNTPIKFKLYNSGNLPAKITDISITSNDPISENCKAKEIQANKDCEITLTLAKKTSNAIVVLTVKYQEGTTTSSFSYGLSSPISASPTFMTAINFNNTIPGKAEEKEATLENNGSSAFQITKITQGAQISAVGATGSGKTPCNNMTILAPKSVSTIPSGQVKTCSLKVSYTPTSSISNTSYIMAEGTYQDTNDNRKSAFAYLPIPYSGITLATVLKMPTTPYSINTYAGSSKDEDIGEISNTSAQYSATISISYTPSPNSGLSLINTGNYCKNNLQLAPNKSCILRIRHAPKGTSATTKENIIVKLIKLDTFTLASPPQSSVEVSATTQTIPVGTFKVEYQGATASNGKIITETNSSGIVNGILIGHKIIHTYQITNTSSNDIKIKIPSLALDPIWGWHINTNTCNLTNGINVGSICQIKVEKAHLDTSLQNFGEDGVSIRYEYTSIVNNSWQTNGPTIIMGDKGRFSRGYTEPSFTISKPSGTPDLVYVGDNLQFTINLNGYNSTATLPSGITVQNSASHVAATNENKCDFRTTLEQQNKSCTVTLTKTIDEDAVGSWTQSAGITGPGTIDSTHRFAWKYTQNPHVMDKGECIQIGRLYWSKDANLGPRGGTNGGPSGSVDSNTANSIMYGLNNSKKCGRTHWRVPTTDEFDTLLIRADMHKNGGPFNGHLFAEQPSLSLGSVGVTNLQNAAYLAGPEIGYGGRVAEHRRSGVAPDNIQWLDGYGWSCDIPSHGTLCAYRVLFGAFNTLVQGTSRKYTIIDMKQGIQAKERANPAHLARLWAVSD